MLEEPAGPRTQRGENLAALSREDLDLYAVEELEARIAGLEAEILRTRGRLDVKRAGRAAADALFGTPRTGEEP